MWASCMFCHVHVLYMLCYRSCTCLVYLRCSYTVTPSFACSSYRSLYLRGSISPGGVCSLHLDVCMCQQGGEMGRKHKNLLAFWCVHIHFGLRCCISEGICISGGALSSYSAFCIWLCWAFASILRNQCIFIDASLCFASCMTVSSLCLFLEESCFLDRLRRAVALVLGDRSFLALLATSDCSCILTCFVSLEWVFFFFLILLLFLFFYTSARVGYVLTMHSSRGRLRTCLLSLWWVNCQHGVVWVD